MTELKFRLNYYVGSMLAQGGNMWVEDSKIVFSPTSALDRAMGAKNVEIPIQKIQGAEFKGEINRSFCISTVDRLHRFQGSQAKTAWEYLEKIIREKQPTAAPAKAPPPAPTYTPKATDSLKCEHCAKNVLPGFSFCPHCASPIKSICGGCRKAVLPDWVVCAFCGWKFGAAAKSA